MPNDKFKFEEEKGTPKIVVTISGIKGTGKTTFMFSPTTFEGTHRCVSFDHKSNQIKKNLYEDDSRIKVYDGEKYYIRTMEEMVPSSIKNYEYLDALVDFFNEDPPNWIDFDCLERFAEICEMTMRYNHGLKPFAGIKEQTIWKERRILVGNLHRKALSIAKKGVIYTTFLDYKDPVLIDDEFADPVKMPRYFGQVRDETDVIFRTSSKLDRASKNVRFYAMVASSKVPKFRTGKLVDITDIYKRKKE